VSIAIFSGPNQRPVGPLSFDKKRRYNLVNSIAIVTITILFSSLGFAKNLAVFAGGGEESPGKTDFDKQFGLLTKLLEQDRWDVSYLYKAEGPKTKTFKAINFEDQIKSIIEKIGSDNNHELKSGDQIIVYIATHGGPKGQGAETHDVATIDGTMNLNILVDLKKKAEAHGVKLALIDQSCFSGSMQTLKSPTTCVVSASTPDKSAYFGETDEFAFHFSESILHQNNSNLEAVFLNARKAVSSAGQPMISTQAGEKTAKVLQVFTKYLVFAKDLERPKMCTNASSDYFMNMLALEEAALGALLPDKEVYTEVAKLLRKSISNRSQLGMYRQAIQEGPTPIFCTHRNIDNIEDMKHEDGVCIDGGVYKNIDSVNSQLEDLKSQLEDFDKFDEKDPEGKLSKSEYKDQSRRDIIDSLGALNRMTVSLYFKEKSSHVFYHDMNVHQLNEVERKAYSILYSYFSQQAKEQTNSCSAFKL
jgi:hypothetical protein